MIFNMISLPNIYYVSQGESVNSHLLNIEKVCRSGCKLIQLRLKNVRFEEVLETTELALGICRKFNAKLIINDYIQVAEKFPQLGLHLGKNDVNFKEARKRLPNHLIGGTANTAQDCVRLNIEGADYIGLGPYHFTSTKTNLDPIIGFEGYKEIINELKERNMNTPIYAIGGIQEEDISKLIGTGVKGVAVSSLLTKRRENDIKTIINRYE